ncbi:MAG: MFS transporter [Nocardioides sp.]
MSLGNYAALMRNPTVRNILVLGFVIRVPIWACNIAITLHVVNHLHRSYTQAGAVTMASALALALSNPWRGRLVDRIGVRRAIAPSLVVTALAWGVAPWVGYWPMLVLVVVAGLFAVPTFAIVRAVLISSVSDQQRTSALAIDSVVTEASYMVGPILGVMAATYLPTTWALLLCQAASVAAAALLWLNNPSVSGDAIAEEEAQHAPVRSWLTPQVGLILVASAAATLILTSEELGSVAAMRSMGHSGWLGWELALWGGGSAIGGLTYGVLHRHPPTGVLLALLGATTALVAVAPNTTWFTVLLFLSGVFCAPTITATADDLSRLVPRAVRSESMGWHGAALTLGSAVGAPIVGWVMDEGGWARGFLAGGLAGLAIALLSLGAVARHTSNQARG